MKTPRFSYTISATPGKRPAAPHGTRRIREKGRWPLPMVDSGALAASQPLWPGRTMTRTLDPPAGRLQSHESERGHPDPHPRPSASRAYPSPRFVRGRRRRGSHPRFARIGGTSPAPICGGRGWTPVPPAAVPNADSAAPCSAASVVAQTVATRIHRRCYQRTGRQGP